MTSPKTLGLPQNIESEMESIIHKNRMLWETWIESAGSYKEFAKSLSSRGYQNISTTPSSMMNLSKLMDSPSVNTNKIKHQKTMLRKSR